MILSPYELASVIVVLLATPRAAGFV